MVFFSLFFQNFQNEKATLKENDGLMLVKEMANDVSNMMKFKIDAVNVSISAGVKLVGPRRQLRGPESR